MSIKHSREIWSIPKELDFKSFWKKRGKTEKQENGMCVVSMGP